MLRTRAVLASGATGRVARSFARQWSTFSVSSTGTMDDAAVVTNWRFTQNHANTPTPPPVAPNYQPSMDSLYDRQRREQSVAENHATRLIQSLTEQNSTSVPAPWLIPLIVPSSSDGVLRARRLAQDVAHHLRIRVDHPEPSKRLTMTEITQLVAALSALNVKCTVPEMQAIFWALDAALRSRENGPEMLSLHNVVQLARGFSNAGYESDALYDFLVSKATSSDWSTSDVQTILSAFGGVPNMNSALYSKVAKHLPQVNMAPGSVVDVAHDLAAKGVRQPEIFTALADKLSPTTRILDLEEVAKATWGFATAGYINNDMFSRLASKGTEILNTSVVIKPREPLVKLVWSFATQGHLSPSLFDATATHFISALETEEEKFRPEDLGIIAWAYAANDHPNERLFNLLSESAMKRIRQRELPPQEIVSICWALRTLNHRGPTTDMLYDVLTALDFYVKNNPNKPIFTAQDERAVAWILSSRRDAPDATYNVSMFYPWPTFEKKKPATA